MSVVKLKYKIVFVNVKRTLLLTAVPCVNKNTCAAGLIDLLDTCSAFGFSRVTVTFFHVSLAENHSPGGFKT